MRRLEGAPEPAKFLGHGPCDRLSRTQTLARFTADAGDIGRAAVDMLHAMAIPAEEMRGVGIAVSAHTQCLRRSCYGKLVLC